MYGRLVILKKAGGLGPVFPLKRRTCMFGSAETSEICIKRDEVRDKHAKVEAQPVSNLLFITNLAYDNGVLVNDVAMTTNQKLQLADKDVITICGRNFLVEAPGMLVSSILIHNPLCLPLCSRSWRQRERERECGLSRYLFISPLSFFPSYHLSRHLFLSSSHTTHYLRFYLLMPSINCNTSTSNS